MTFQIDTAATCNTLSENTLLRLMPKMKLTKSPYLLHPYDNAQPLKPLGQIDLLCERNRRYETLTFQVIPRDVMLAKPALLSGSDCETLGLIIIKADELFSLITAVTESTGKRAPPPPPPTTKPARHIPAKPQAAQQRTPTAHPRKPQAAIWTTPTRTNSAGNPQRPHPQNP